MTDQEVGMYVCTGVFVSCMIALYFLLRDIKVTVTKPGKDPFKI